MVRCIQYYSVRCDIANSGSETKPPLIENAQAFKKWDIKVGKALYVIKTTIEKITDTYLFKENCSLAPTSRERADEFGS